MASADRITTMTFTRQMTVAVCTALPLLPFAIAFARAQAPADKPKFEVASVRQNTADDGKVLFGIQPGGRFTTIGFPLPNLIMQAYGLQRSQLVGGPDWMQTARFDITAKAEGEIPRTALGSMGPLQLMLQDLLEERFKLRAHRETREQQIYALRLARPDGQLGPGLRASTTDCAALFARGRSGPPPPGRGPGERPACGMRIGPGQLVAGAMPISGLIPPLSQFTERLVFDRTGLTGNFEIDLTWTPDRLPQGPPPPGAPPLPAADPNGPSLFTALQEQLGLKLESERAPVEVLAIDHVERPTPD
jgi:uncharacterized protein (TIGR03435 family)